MARSIIRQKRRADIVFPILTLSLVGVAAALSAIGDGNPSLLDGVDAFISTQTIARNVDAAAPAVGSIPFIAVAVMAPRIRSFGGKARRSMVVAAAGSTSDDSGAVLQTAARQEANGSARTACMQAPGLSSRG